MLRENWLFFFLHSDPDAKRKVLNLEGRQSPTLVFLRRIWGGYCKGRSLDVGPRTLNFNQVLQLIFRPGLLNLEKHCFKVKVANPHARQPQLWRDCPLSPPSSTSQHRLPTTRRPPALSRAIILPSHTLDPSSSGRV